MRKCETLLSVSILVLIPLISVSLAVLSEECRTSVSVDREVGVDCSILTRSLVNQTCHELQDVLRSISLHATAPNASGECVEVRLNPGVYVLTELTPIDSSLVLQGIGNVTVKVDVNVSTVPQYVLSFIDSERARISGINFHTSPAIITFENVTSVIIERSSFRYFSQGAVDIFNCPTAVVRNCVFEHNGPVSVTKPQKYRGHAGGLSIAYYEEGSLPGPYALVSHCVFRNNSSDPLANLQSTSQLFKQFIFTGRGGGCAVNISPLYPLNATVEDCYFENNFARSFGGGLYVGFNGNSNHTVVVNRVKLVRNQTPRAAGGLEIGFVQGAALYSVNSIFVYNSEFIENHSERGAGAYVFVPGPIRSDGQLSNFAHFENCTFTGNIAEEFGAAIGLVSPVLAFNRNNSESIRPFEIESCTFNANNGNDGGAVSTAHLPLSFGGSNTFNQNRGRTFVVMGALVKVSGGMHFVANDGLGINGGAMYLASLGQLFLSQGANFTFEGNKGVIGAAIIVDTNNVVPEVYSQLHFNPLCFLLYENASQSPDQWENVAFTFSGNKAIIASSVFMSDLALCSWLHFESPSFDPASVFRWSFVQFSDDNENTAHEPDAFNPEWYIQTPAQQINITANSISAYPGEPFRISIKAYDELGRPTAAVLRLSERDDITHYVFNPAVSTLNRIDDSTISTSFYSLTSIGFGRSEDILIAALLGEESSRDTFTLVSASCPPGYVLSAAPLQSNMYTTCECDYQNPDIVDCNGRSIILREGLWAVLNNRSANNQLVSYSCPPQYCQCALQYSGRTAVCKFTFNSQSPDKQCSCVREGELCGNCRNGYGVSVLLNKCVTCHSASAMFIAALIVADIVVFAGLLLLIKTFPTWLYPFLFYIQMLPYLTQHFPLTFEKVHSYAYYVSSGLSFYFIYDFCLYHGMSAPVSYLLRYLPLGVALGICCVVLVIRKVTKKPRDPGHGLWWIVLFMYTHVVHTSMSILNCPPLPGRSGDLVPRWYINGNIACFQGGHVPLGLLAILILAFCGFAIPLVLVYSAGWVQHPGWLRHTAEVMRKGFKEKYKWWATVELGRRVLLLLFIVPFPGNDYPAMFILSVIIVVFGFIQPYKNMYNNVLESLLSLDVFVLLLLRNTGQISDKLEILPLNNFTANECTVIDGVTGFTWLLLPFYYASIIAILVVIVVVAAHSVRHYILNRHSNFAVSEPQEDVGRIQRAITTTELDIDSLKLVATAYTAFNDAEAQHVSNTDPDGGALVITIKPADH